MRPTSRSAIQLFIDRLLDRSVLGEEEIRALQGLSGYTALAKAHIDIVSPGQTQIMHA